MVGTLKKSIDSVVFTWFSKKLSIRSGFTGRSVDANRKNADGVFAASEHGREALKQVALFGIVRSLIFGVPLNRQNVPPRGEFDGFDSAVFRVTGADLEPACKSRYRLVVP